MSTANDPVRFGDVIKLQTKSAFVESASTPCLGFLELMNKAQTPVLVVPPVKDEVKDRFVEIDFIIAPIRSDKPPANGTPLLFETPFVLRTSDGKDGSTYSLNNKVAGQRDAISLQVSSTKGEMYMQVEKEGCTTATELCYGTDGLSLRVVDSNRVRKTLNHLLSHVVRPKSDMLGGLVTCGGKGSTLTFSFQRSVDADGQVKTETIKLIKNPQARRSSIESLGPAKVDQLGRADRIDSSEFSDVDALSRSSSMAGFGSNPASPRSTSMTSGLATPVNAVAVAERLAVVPDVDDSVTTTAGTKSAPPVSNEMASSAIATDDEPQRATVAVSPSKPVATTASPLKPVTNKAKAKASPASSPVKAVASVSSLTTEKAETKLVEAEPVKTESVLVEAQALMSDEPKAQVESSAHAAPATTTSVPASTVVATTAPRELKTVVADASTFPPMPVINGPAPAPIVSSPKASPPSSTTVKAVATPTNVPLAPKMLKDEELAKLKAEAEIEDLHSACGATCSIM